MRKIIFLCATFALLVGCNPDKQPVTPDKEYVTIGFENAELLTHTGGLFDYYDNILWAKEIAPLIDDEEDIMDGSLWYDDILYTENIIGLGSFYTDYWGSYDTWGGFAISNTASMTNEGYTGYAGQFNVMATEATKFAVGYDAGGFNGAKYERPTIILSEPKTFTSAEFANTTLAYNYTTDAENSELWYTITATGYLNGTETGKVDIEFVKDGVAFSDWKEVALESLGEVDKIVFTADSNDRNAYGILFPAYFCMDNLKYEIVK